VQQLVGDRSGPLDWSHVSPLISTTVSTTALITPFVDLVDHADRYAVSHGRSVDRTTFQRARSTPTGEIDPFSVVDRRAG
jgi:hypothetical protein